MRTGNWLTLSTRATNPFRAFSQLKRCARGLGIDYRSLRYFTKCLGSCLYLSGAGLPLFRTCFEQVYLTRRRIHPLVATVKNSTPRPMPSSALIFSPNAWARSLICLSDVTKSMAAARLSAFNFFCATGWAPTPISATRRPQKGWSPKKGQMRDRSSVLAAHQPAASL